MYVRKRSVSGYIACEIPLLFGNIRIDRDFSFQRREIPVCRVKRKRLHTPLAIIDTLNDRACKRYRARYVYAL